MPTDEGQDVVSEEGVSLPIHVESTHKRSNSSNSSNNNTGTSPAATAGETGSAATLGKEDVFCGGGARRPDPREGLSDLEPELGAHAEKIASGKEGRTNHVEQGAGNGGSDAVIRPGEQVRGDQQERDNEGGSGAPLQRERQKRQRLDTLPDAGEAEGEKATGHVDAQEQRELSVLEEEEEEEEEQEQGLSGEWTGWVDDDGDRSDGSRENDGFLDEFVRELDGASDADADADEQGEGGEKEQTWGVGGKDGDEQVARALQEEEWRRNPPQQVGQGFGSRSVSSDDMASRQISSIVCSETRGSSIFDVGGPPMGVSRGAGRVFRGGSGDAGSHRSGGSTGGSGASAPASATGGGGAAASPGGGGSTPRSRVEDGIVEDATFDEAGAGRQAGGVRYNASHQSAIARMTKGGGSGTACSTGGLFRKEDEVAAAGQQSGCKAGRRTKRTGTPVAWPPGGLGEGEGLRINDLPDEIVDNVAGFAVLPRCVSKRIERYRVKVVRERVIAALKSSAKLPVSKAQEVEEAIFALCGGYVTKAYKAKAREMSFNLRVGKNDPLRERLLSGFLLPSELVRMSSNDLAPLSVRQERERLVRKRLREVTSSRDSPLHTVTTRFICQECGHERTQYRTWRRKAVVDRVRVIVQCLQCRHTWEL